MKRPMEPNWVVATVVALAIVTVLLFACLAGHLPTLEG